MIEYRLKKDTDVWQVGGSVMHVPSGLLVHVYWEQEDNKGTQLTTLNFKTPTSVSNSAANENAFVDTLAEDSTFYRYYVIATK